MTKEEYLHQEIKAYLNSCTSRYESLKLDRDEAEIILEILERKPEKRKWKWFRR